MLEIKSPDSTCDQAWPDADHSLRVPDTSMLPGSATLQALAVNPLKQAVQGAHDSIDRVAQTVLPAMQKLGENVSAAEHALHATADKLRDTGSEWADTMHTTVRRKPLACVVAAVALGAVIARVTR